MFYPWLNHHFQKVSFNIKTLVLDVYAYVTCFVNFLDLVYYATSTFIGTLNKI